MCIRDRNSAIDTCGTGGSGSGKYNVSTAASLVAAGAGSIIAKHGNRSLSSKSGSSQVLEELGVKLDIEPKKITKCMERANIGFMFAPNHHPAMKYVGPVRQKLGVRTIFNILGPLSNPANVKKQLIGVFDKKWLKPMAETLKNLGSQRALLVNGSDGFDELTTTGISNVTELNEGNIVSYKINPKDLGLKLSKTNDLIGGDPKQNAKKIMLEVKPDAVKLEGGKKIIEELMDSLEFHEKIEIIPKYANHAGVKQHKQLGRGHACVQPPVTRVIAYPVEDKKQERSRRQACKRG